MDVTAARFGRTATLLAGIRAGGNNLCRLPKRLFQALSGLRDRSGALGLVRLTVAGAAQVRCCRASDATLLLPVELRYVNHIASTNGGIVDRIEKQEPYNSNKCPTHNPLTK
jgi:hypothetical protein